MTETFEPYRPDMSYDLDYDEEPQPGRAGRVLWGRVAILGLALLLAFLLGRATGGGSDGVAQSEYDEVVAERDELAAEVTTLEEQLDAAQEPTPGPTTSPGTAAGGEDDATDPEDESEGGETYTVQSGDTLASIAGTEYGDTSLASFIAEANGIAVDDTLFIGQELILPPAPE